MLFPLAIAIAGFFGYKSYKKTGKIPFLDDIMGPKKLPPKTAPIVEPGFAAPEPTEEILTPSPVPEARPEIFAASTHPVIRQNIPQVAPLMQKIAAMKPEDFIFQPRPKA